MSPRAAWLRISQPSRFHYIAASDTLVQATFIRQVKNMKQSQSRVIWGAIAIVAVFCIVPPWTETYQSSGTSRTYTPRGYYPIFLPPSADGRGGIVIDIDRLLLQFFVVFVISGGLFVFFGQEPAVPTTSAAEQAAARTPPSHECAEPKPSKQRTLVRDFVWLLIAVMCGAVGYCLRILEVLYAP